MPAESLPPSEVTIGSPVVTKDGIPGVVSSFSFAFAWVRVSDDEVRYERIDSLKLEVSR